MKLCILVCTLNEAKYIASRLENLDAQTKSPGVISEIHVLDNGSVDATREIASNITLPQGTPVFVHALPADGKCASLFWAFRNVQGDYYVLTDANTVFGSATLAALADAMTPSPALIIGNTRSVRSSGDGEDFIASACSMPLRMRIEQLLGVNTGANGACYAVSRRAVDGIWRLPPVRNDDFVISIYAGAHGNAVFQLDARAYEIEDFSLIQVWRQKYRDAQGHHQAIAWILRNTDNGRSQTAAALRLFYWSLPMMVLVAGLALFSWYFAVTCIFLGAVSRKFRVISTRIAALFCGYAAGVFHTPAAKWQPSR